MVYTTLKTITITNIGDWKSNTTKFKANSVKFLQNIPKRLTKIEVFSVIRF